MDTIFKNYNYMKKILLSLLIVALLPLAALAQTPDMMSMARAELVKRGLDETEVRARLLENGIDVDNIPPTEYANYQSRVTAILDQMQAEKSGKDQKANPEVKLDENTSALEKSSTNAGGTNVTKSTAGIAQTTMGEAAAEAALKESLEKNQVSDTEGNDIYGHSLFTGQSLDVFRTTDGAQAPDSYVLGEGDEVHISIFGSSQTEIQQRIGADGSIHPAGSTKIFLKGMTLAQGRTTIQNKLAQHYSFRPDQIAVTITTARTVTVSIYGEVGVQGGFTLSALNTSFNALAAAGGPTAMGSVRNIQLSRGGKVTRLDIYEYMKNPTIGTPFDIQNGDVIFVPIAQKIVTIEGAVNRPMRYEVIDGETVADLVEYAGGLTWNAYPKTIEIERFDGEEVTVLNFDLNSVMSGNRKASLQAGDIVRVKSINQPSENFVAVEGDVYYTGRYELSKNASLKQLLDNAKPRHTARTDYVFVERTKQDETVEVITVPFPGMKGNPDFQLQARDKVTILTMVDYRDVDTIAVSGEVRRPFARTFGLNDRMTVGQAVEYAGGLKTTVFPVAYIFRKDVTNPDKMQYLRVNLDTDGDMLLQPGDRLNIYDNTTYTNVGEISVSGAVKSPFGTAFDGSLTVHDMLAMAGGFELGASYDRVEVFRLHISDRYETRFEVITLQVDHNYNLIGNTSFQLQPFDHIVVRMTPDFSKGRTVEVNGRVRYPGVYVLADNKTQLWEVIEMAGGLLDDADPHTSVFRTQGRNIGRIGVDLRKAKKGRGKDKYDPYMMDGDVINIVRLENTVTIREIGTRMAQYVPSEYSSTEKVVVYQGAHGADWYIRRFAGGFQKTADRNSVTVTYANNYSDGTDRFLGIRCYPTVEPGAVITLRLDDKKVEAIEKPKEKIDWGVEIRNMLAGLTSVVSIILLMKNLNN